MVSTLRAKDFRKKATDIIKPMSGDFAVVYFVYVVLVGAITGIFSAIGSSGGIRIDPNTLQIVGAVDLVAISSALSSLFYLLTTGAFNFSFINLVKNAHSKQGKPKVSDLFFGFKERYSQSLGIYIITSIFIVLWSLLLIIPGIIKTYSYAMSKYIAFDSPNKSTLDCIAESRKIMDGNKWKLFCLELSYIGWFLLVILTLGILSFWVLPKYEQAHYEFYLHINQKD